MPKNRKSKNDGAERRTNDPFGMMGMMGGMEPDSTNQQDLEAELADILGEGQTKPKQSTDRSKQPTGAGGKKYWGDLDAQITASMKDVVDSDSDAEEDGDLMNELSAIVNDDLDVPKAALRKSPSPQPRSASPGGILDTLLERKTMYETAIANAKQNNESSKVRRLTRGLSTLTTLIKKAKSGKSVNEEEIPPLVATGSKPVSAESAKASQSPPPVPASQAPPPIPVRTAPAQPVSIEVSQPPQDVAVAAAAKVEENESIVKWCDADDCTSVDEKLLAMLKKRQHEYMEAAMKAKHAGNKIDAIKYLKLSKQFAPVIDAVTKGQKVDLSQMPPSPMQESNLNEVPKPPIATATRQQASDSSEPQQPPEATAAAPPNAAAAPSKPKTVLEGLLQRHEKYKATAEQAKTDGSSSKARRMGRIAKQYESAIKAHKAGQKIDFDELPVPPGFPPLPGVNETPTNSLLQAEEILSQPNVSPSPSNQSLQDSVKKSPSRQQVAPVAASVPVRPQPEAKQSHGITAYQQQIEYLQNREKAFKEAAIEAKNKGDKETALDLLRKMKQLKPMIEQAKNGLKVDITAVPQPPLLKKNFDLDSTEKSVKGSVKKQSSEEDEALFIRLLNSLKEQVKKARGYSQQFTHAGDVAGADTFDKLSDTAQRDYDIVRNRKRHKDQPPRFHYEKKTFKCINMIADLNSNEMEIDIIQAINLPQKDIHPYVEWELPYPTDNPSKGRTDETKSSTFEFNQKFRIPIDRRQRAFQGTMKRKSLKVDVVQKGGFLRSAKVIGTASIKLQQLETKCELHAVEQLKEGRQLAGKIDVKVRLRTPLLESESTIVTEQWLIIDHAQTSIPRPSSGLQPAPTSKSKLTKPKNPSSSVCVLT